MKTLLIAIAGLLGLAVLFVIGVFVVSEVGGEVVILETADADGGSVETHLWVVEHEGHSWLRAGVPTSGWLQRIEADPHVTLTRGDETLAYRAVPVRDPETRDRIHALMREAYPFADRYVSLIRDPDGSVPVRLDPIHAGR